MFLQRRPSDRDVERFLEEASALPLSYSPVGLASQSPRGFRADEARVRLGTGDTILEKAWNAVRTWRHFELGWVELFPRAPTVEPGTVVAVVVRHLGFWSINGCRIVYLIDEPGVEYGLAYGTLTNHAESGEEIFRVSRDAATGEVFYSIRAVARARAPLARVGYPVTRFLQSRFRADSMAALQRAVGAGG